MSVLLEDLYKIQKKDLSRVGTVLSDAFQHDPIWMKLFEGEDNNKEKLHAFYQIPVKYCIKYGESYSSSGNLEGIAGWMPGKFSKIGFWRMLIAGLLPLGLKLGANIGKKMQPMDDFLCKERFHNMKDRSFIYLMIIGVGSKFQGKGFGGKIIRAVIEKSEKENLPIYLETETENNVKMYEKFGFKVIKKVVLPQLDLPMWEMVRENK